MILPEIDWAKLAYVSEHYISPFPKIFYDKLKPLLKTRVSCVMCMASTPYKTDYIFPKNIDIDEEYKEQLEEWEKLLNTERVAYTVFRDGKISWNVPEPPYSYYKNKLPFIY